MFITTPVKGGFGLHQFKRMLLMFSVVRLGDGGGDDGDDHAALRHLSYATVVVGPGRQAGQT